MITYFLFSFKAEVKSLTAFVLPIGFFILLLWIVPLTLPYQTQIPHNILLTLMWIAVLTTNFLHLETLFEEDVQEGFVDHYRFFPFPYSGIFFIKSLLFILMRHVPLCIIIAITLFMYGFTGAQMEKILFCMIITMISISFFSVLGSILCAGYRHKNGLIFILIIPLIIPAIIFGAGGGVSTASLSEIILLPLGFCGFSIVITVILSETLISILLEEI